MTRATVAAGAFAVVFVLVAIGVGYVVLQQRADPAASLSIATTSETVAGEAHPSLLYGRITVDGGTTYEGRLRWGGNQEAFWGDYFNGVKDQNPWASQVPPERLRGTSQPIEIFGIELAKRERPADLGRPFMARFGDISRIELVGVDVRVTLKSGTVFDLDWNAFHDFDDGVRVWDGLQGVLDLAPAMPRALPGTGADRIRAIDLLPAPGGGAIPPRLHGTVRTPQGAFSGFIQWNRNEGLGTDQLDGRTTGGPLSVRFDAIRSIARHSRDSSLVTLLDGREVVLSGTAEAGRDNLGIYVDDQRYGRVLVSWDAFERLEFSPGASGPTYRDFPPGRPLTGIVTTRAGRRFAGRLVYDLDESETTETLDAPSLGVDFTIPFGLIVSIVLPDRGEPGADRATVTLQSGEALQLERAGDLGEGNAGMLIFINGSRQSEYVAWTDLERIDFQRPPSMYPPHGGR
ncbi:MAG: hypothetical protein AB1806_06205 [Acidobacteriota bacterium]